MKLFFIAFVIFSITNSIYLWRSTGRLIRANNMRYLLIPLIIASLACGVNTSLPYSQNMPEVLPQVEITNTHAAPEMSMVVTAETLQIRTGAGEEYPALRVYLSQNEIVTCSSIDRAEDGGQWCKHDLGWSNIRYMKGLK